MKKLVVFVSLIVICLIMPISVSADNGGQADVSGKIIFYEDSSSQKPVEPSSSSETKKKSTELPKKSDSSLPYTGETVRKSIMWIGVCLILCCIILLVRKKRRDHDEKES